MMNLTRPMLIALLVLTVAGTAGAQSAASDDPFGSAAAKVNIQVYRPTNVPAEFTLGSLQAVTNPSDVLMATYYSADDRQIHIMQTTPEGLECPDCATVEVDGTPCPYSREDTSDGYALVDLTVIKGKTAVLLGLRQKNLDTTKALLVLRPIAEGMEVVQPQAGSPVTGKQSAIREAAGGADFAVYAPEDLPQYFYLKTVAYSPAGLAEDGEMATPEQLLITYASTTKQITVLVQPPGAFQMKESAGRSKVTVRDWKGLAWKEDKQAALALDAGDAMILLTGNVQQSTLLSVARSLERVR